MTTKLEKLKARTIENENGCWIFQGYKNSDGYGKVRFEGKVTGAHRIMYQLAVDEIPEGLCVMHSCDTPDCLNPDHLSVGTHKENMHDAIRKGRLSIVRTDATNGNYKIPPSEVIRYRKMYQAGATLESIMRLTNTSRTTVASMLYGTTHPDLPLFKREDALMNVKGVNSPTFKGYYVTPWGEFTSLHNASDACPTKLHFATLNRFCRINNNKVIRSSSATRSEYLTQDDAGKTYAEIGFGFRSN